MVITTCTRVLVGLTVAEALWVAGEREEREKCAKDTPVLGTKESAGAAVPFPRSTTSVAEVIANRGIKQGDYPRRTSVRPHDGLG